MYLIDDDGSQAANLDVAQQVRIHETLSGWHLIVEGLSDAFATYPTEAEAKTALIEILTAVGFVTPPPSA